MHQRQKHTYAYVPCHLVPDWMDFGWMPVADLGPVHGSYSCLMRACICRRGE